MRRSDYEKVNVECRNLECTAQSRAREGGPKGKAKVGGAEREMQGWSRLGVRTAV